MHYDTLMISCYNLTLCDIKTQYDALHMCIDAYVKFNTFWRTGDMLTDYLAMVIFDALRRHDNIYWTNMTHKRYLTHYGAFDDILTQCDALLCL